MAAIAVQYRPPERYLGWKAAMRSPDWFGRAIAQVWVQIAKRMQRLLPYGA
jgi:hypothetical protein